LAVKKSSRTPKAKKVLKVKAVKSKSTLKAKPNKAPKPKAKPKLVSPIAAEKLKADMEKAERLLALKAQEEILAKLTKVLADSTVRQNLIGIGGENALAIVRSFLGNQSDEDLAKKLKIKISDVRATLNKLHNEGLVNYIREKDSETGWYSYSWSLNHQRIEKWATIQLSRLIVHGGGEDFYFCPSCGASSITNFESAAGSEFRCERCNRLLEFIDEKKMLELHEKP
jgi:transcription initiation factor TFIIE subunit alpha